MNILMITHERNLNGASKSLLNLIDQMKDKHTFFVVTPFSDGPMADELKRREIRFFYHGMKRWMRRRSESWIKWKLIQIRWLCFEQFKNIVEAKKIVREIEDLSIDVIHTNVSVVNIGGLVSKMTGIPHIWYIREFGKEDFNMYPVCSSKRLYSFIDEYADTVVVISKALREKYRNLLHKTDIKLIYNGVGSENIYSERAYTCKRNQIKFLISGKIQPAKCQKIAILACAELQKRGIKNFELYVAGRGNVGDLENLFPEESEYVTFLGQVEDMPSLRKKMDVELVCSKSEAFGRVTVEAMMAGMPVIGSNSGGTPELIVDGFNGLLFEPGNFKKLASCMELFITDQKEIEKMGRQAQEYAIEHFSIERCADEVHKQYVAVRTSTYSVGQKGRL